MHRKRDQLPLSTTQYMNARTVNTNFVMTNVIRAVQFQTRELFTSITKLYTHCFRIYTTTTVPQNPISQY